MKKATVLFLASTLFGCGIDGEEGAEDVTQVAGAIENGSTNFSGLDYIRIRTARMEGIDTCSGTVLDPRTVMTARHCVSTTGTPNGAIWFPASSARVRIDGGTFRSAEEIVGLDTAHDVALIFLSAANGLYDSLGHAIFTPLEPEAPAGYLNSSIRITGWGWLTPGSGGNVLRQGWMVVDDDHVPTYFSGGGPVDGILLRRGGTNQGHMSGDSGGPFWGSTGTLPRGVIGLLSDTTSANKSVGARVFEIRNWARSAMSAHHGLAAGAGYFLSFNSSSHLSSASQYADGAAGSWSLVGGYLVQGANVPRSLVVWEDYVVRDFVASVTIDSPDNDGAGILFHFAGPTSYYYCEAHDEENQIRIRSNINGTTTTHAVATWNGTFSSIKTMRVTGSDLLYECSFDGVTVRAVHSRMPVGPVGLIQDHNNGVRFNNFEVDGG